METAPQMFDRMMRERAALLNVAMQAEVIATPAYESQPGPYADGIRREDAVALTKAVQELQALMAEA